MTPWAPDGAKNAFLLSYLSDAGHSEEGGLDQVVTHTAGHRLHQDSYCVPEDGDCGGEDEDAEDEGADRVNDRVLRLEVDYESSSEDSWSKNILMG